MKKALRISLIFGFLFCLATFIAGGLSMAQPRETVSVSLPKPGLSGRVSVEETLSKRRSVRRFKAAPLSLQDLSQLLWAAQGLTDPAGLRTAPSAGALYPLEIYAVVGNVTGLAPGIYKYRPEKHDLLLVSEGDRREELAQASLGQMWMKDSALIVVFAAVYERTTRRYGERGVMYVHMEAGHAAENLCLQAVALSLGTVIVGAFDDGGVTKAVGLRGEEEPTCLVPVGKPQ